MPALYDLMLLLDPNVPEERRQQILTDVRSAIEGDGTLVGAHDWGERRLAFEIDHRGEAVYHLFEFEGEPPLLAKLDHSLKITDGVLRFRTIRLKPGSPPPPMPRPESRGRPERGEEPPPPRSGRDAEAAPRDAEPAPEPVPEPAPEPAPEAEPEPAAEPVPEPAAVEEPNA